MVRRLLLCLAILVPAFAAWPASAACEADGTIPGTAAKTYTVSAGNLTFYIDDRDYADLDDDGVAGGIWIYLESNGVEGLQYSKYNGALMMIPGSLPVVPESNVEIVPSPGVSQTVTVPGGLPPDAQNIRTSVSNGLVVLATTTDAVTVTLFGPRDRPLPPDEEAVDNRPNAGGYRIVAGSISQGGATGPALATALGEADPCYVDGIGDTNLF
jgi:hypothetical protein